MANKRTTPNREVETNSKAIFITCVVWIVILLVLAVIGLTAYILTDEHTLDGRRLIQVISAASTLLSITLSIFAIQLTFTSNKTIGRQYEIVHDAAMTMEQSSNKVQHATDTLSHKVDVLTNEIKEIKSKVEPIKEFGDNQKVLIDQIESFKNNTKK